MLGRALRAATADPESRKLFRWIFAILGVFLIGAIVVAALAGAAFGFLYSSATSADRTPSTRPGAGD